MSDQTSSPSRPASPVGALPDIPSARPYRFTWDPSSRRPGPASVSEATEGRGDYFASQAPVGLFNTSSSNLTLGALPSDWSSSKHGFHAISTVLNNPHKRQAPPKAHSALPAVPPADLPRVRRKDFDSYLRAVAPEWERFERNSRLGRDGAAQLDGPSTPRISVTSDTPPPSTPRPGKSIPPLNSVPPVFFEPTFNLGDPRTFNLVTEQRGGEDEASDPSSISYSLPLLEKMSHYADTIEQHLVLEISLRSTSFFAALTNLQDLQTESEQCLDRISRLRGLLNDVDEKGAKRGLQVIQKEIKMRNLSAVREGVKMLHGVVEMTGVAKGLAAAGQWGEALGVIEELETLYNSEAILPQPPTHSREQSKTLPSLPEEGNGRLSPDPSSDPSTIMISRKKSTVNIPLSSFQAFTSLPSHLRILTLEIASSLTSEVVSVLRVDLLERITFSLQSPSKTIRDVDQSLKDRLRPLLHGLMRAKSVREATISWREVVMGEVLGAIRRHLPFELDDDDPPSQKKADSDQRAGLANHLRNMSHSEFIGLLRTIYRSLLNGVEGLQTQIGLIVEVLTSLQSSSSPIDLPALREELTDILSSAAEYSNTTAAKIATLRSEQHVVLDLPNFLSFFNETWNFVLKCEVISRRMIVGLRGVVVSQAKVFLQTFHQARISGSAKLVEDEQWNPTEISSSLQGVADVLVDAAVRDPPELVISSELTASPTNEIQLPSSAMPSPSAPANGSSAGARHLRIEDKTYYAVSATAEVLVLLLDYLKVIVNLSMLTTDTMSRIIEFLKAFNSRTCQVVLGAGAMRSAGLKNITAKHLALASQSLSIMIALIPYIRETFRRHLSQKQAVMLVEFDKLKRDYQEHQNEIHSKLIAIMGDRLTAHIKTLQVVKWDTPNQGGGVNGYMELLVKETVTLHKVLSRYLSTPIVEYVMTQVFAAINHRLSEEFTAIELPSQEAKERLLADAKYLHQKLAALKNVGTPSSMLETVIAEKRIASKNVPLSPAPGTTANQRIMGMLARKQSENARSPVVEKALPTPTPSLPSPLHSIPASTPPISTPPINGASLDGQKNANGFITSSSETLPLRLSHDESNPGFKQVEPSSEVDVGAESSLPPAPPNDTGVIVPGESNGIDASEQDYHSRNDVTRVPPVVN